MLGLRISCVVASGDSEAPLELEQMTTPLLLAPQMPLLPIALLLPPPPTPPPQLAAIGGVVPSDSPTAAVVESIKEAAEGFERMLHASVVGLAAKELSASPDEEPPPPTPPLCPGLPGLPLLPPVIVTPLSDVTVAAAVVVAVVKPTI